MEKYDAVYLEGLEVPEQLETALEQSLTFSLIGEISLSPSSLTIFNYQEGMYKEFYWNITDMTVWINISTLIAIYDDLIRSFTEDDFHYHQPNLNRNLSKE